MNQRVFLFIYVLSFFCLNTSAQGHNSKENNHNSKKAEKFITAYCDSLNTFRTRQDSSVLFSSHNSLTKETDCRMPQLFLPLTFYHNTVTDALRLDNRKAQHKDPLSSAIDSTLLHIYLTRPDLVVNSQRRLDAAGVPRQEVDRPVRHDVDIVDQMAPTPIELGVTPVDVMVKRPNFWTFSGDYYLQLMQNCVSGNWYKGGESSYSMVGSATLQAIYNTKQGFKWENKLEMKLGFQNSRSDSLHTIKTTEDLIRYTGKVGLQATKRWYYTMQLIAYTQFAKGYKSNDSKVYSAFLSPLNANLSIGMDYNANWLKGKLTGNIHIAPLAYNFKYVERLELATRYGLEEGKHFLHDFGSEFTADLTWQIANNLKWKTRLYGYTTYERTELEWENTFTFSFNKYISSNLFIYPRFDDGATRDDHHGYWQFKEYASLGFSYSF